MNLKKAVIFLALASLITPSAQAIDSVSEKAIEGQNAKNVSFEGTLLPSAVKNPMKNQVSLEVLYPGMSGDSFAGNAKSDVIKYMAQTAADDDGKYRFDFVMDGKSGKYPVRIKYMGSEIETFNYDYVSPEEFDELFSGLNEALKNKDAAALKKTIDEFCEKGIITIDKYEEMKQNGEDTDAVFEYMANLEKIENVADLNQRFAEGAVIKRIEGLDNPDNIFNDEEIRTALSIKKEIADMYKKLNDEKKKAVYSKAKEKYSDAQQLSEALEKTVITKTFEDVLWQEVYGAIYDNNTLFNVDFTDYEKLSTKKAEYTLQYFADNSKRAVDVKSVKELFDEAVKKGEAYEPGGSTGGNTGSGGTSSGGSSSSGGSKGGTSGGTNKSITPANPEVTKKIDNTVFKAPEFDDLDSVEWAKDAIKTLAERKIVNGKAEGKFFPNDNVKREEFVKMIVDMFELYGDFSTTQFVDVDDKAWYSDYVLAASENGIIKGISAYEFGIGKNIKRKDMAVVIYRVLESKGTEFKDSSIEFVDVCDDYAKEAIEKLTSIGIMKGVSETAFAPDRSATRAEAAMLMYNVLTYIDNN